MATPFSIVCITVPAGPKARRLSDLLVASRLAACVNIVPAVRSVYRWKGKVERARESLLLVKIRTSAFSRVAAFVEKNHPYDVPEIVAVSLDRGNRTYLRWLAAETA